MLPKRQPRCDIDTLTWEYLDGETSPTRLALLETLLRSRKQAREQFVEHSQIHAMLHQHFKAGAGTADASPAEVDTQALIAEPVRRRKRRRGKSNAA